jgi:hypothetical protein
MDQYAAGRFPEALAAFEEALRQDPGSRAARVAVERLQSELAMKATDRLSATRPPGEREPASAEADAPLSRLGRFVEFEDTVGDERERLGRLQAMQGRIAQLLAEKKIARARRRRFAKDAELHALSRRLS